MIRLLVRDDMKLEVRGHTFILPPSLANTHAHECTHTHLHTHTQAFLSALRQHKVQHLVPLAGSNPN